MSAIIKSNFMKEHMYQKVPDSEFEVLKALAKLGEAHGPKVSRALKTVSVASIYKLLSRLEKRGLVVKHHCQVPIDDEVVVRRVLYHVPEMVILQLKEMGYETEKSTTRTLGDSQKFDEQNSEEVL